MPATALATAEPVRVNSLYPTQPPELVQEMVVVAHTNLTRVRQLVEHQPTLAKAAWDWGFGDWETALGAASHIGRPDIADVLLVAGAHPTIFSAAMLGELEVVKAFVTARPGIQRLRGPHSISLMQHAVAGGARSRPVVEYLKTVEGAADGPATQPLSEADLAALAGVYTFGPTPADRIEITVVQRQMQLGRPGHYPRGLFHLGQFEFCPIGAENVRIRFSRGPDEMTLGIYDPDVVLIAAKRIGQTG
jgi:hypothetical protein